MGFSMETRMRRKRLRLSECRRNRRQPVEDQSNCCVICPAKFRISKKDPIVNMFFVTKQNAMRYEWSGGGIDAVSGRNSGWGRRGGRWFDIFRFLTTSWVGAGPAMGF